MATGQGYPWKMAQENTSKKSCAFLEVQFFRSHLGALALKTEDFSKKTGRFSKTQKWIY